MPARKKTKNEENEVKNDEVKTEKAENTFSKAKLVGSKRFANRRDILNVKLKNDKQYTISEAEAVIEEFMKGKGE